MGTIIDRRRAIIGSGTSTIPYDEQYLTFEALEAGTFTFTIPSGVSTTNLTSVSYSLNGGSTWTTTNNVDSTEVVITTPSVAEGDKVLWKGSGKGTGVLSNNTPYCLFSATGNFNVYGNIMSLLKGDNFIGVTSLEQRRAFISLFRSNKKIINAENLILPATTLTNTCYYEMFYGCSNLVSAPELPATTTTSGCYSWMFYSCTSLVTAPDLLASDVKGSAYSCMFNACSSLQYVKMLGETFDSNALYNWMKSVKSGGTFVKKSGIEIESGNSGIPSSWTVIEES